MNKKIEEYSNVGQKDQMKRVALMTATLGYCIGNDNIENVIDNMNKMLISESRLKRIEEKVCYYADKISLITEALGMKRLYQEKRYDDILVLTNYIQEQLDNIVEAVNEVK